jgi:hypothetical protein
LQQKPKARASAQVQFASTDAGPDPKLVKAIVRAHVWLGHLSSGQYKSIEDLAVAAGYNAKVIRQGLRLAFLAPTTMESVINGEPSVRQSNPEAPAAALARPAPAFRLNFGHRML